jgi:tetratricopeptide (TPR) repeat protein
MGKIRPSTQASQLWIYNPWLDLIVGCGAWSAPLLLVSYLSLASSARTWSVVFYALALFFNYPHYMATLYRAYHRAEDFHKYRVFTVHITALIALTILLSHHWLRILPWIFTLYLTWSPWHYSGQNYGLFMMFARRAGADPDRATRRALYSAFIVSYLVLFLGFHTGPSTDPLFLSLGIPAVISRWEQIILIIAFVALSTFGLTRLARITGWRKLVPSLTLFSSQFLWFLLPAAISLIRGIEVPQSRYSSGVLAVMHSAQYLWITSYYARRESREADQSNSRRNWQPLAYFGVLIVGGIALFVPGPWLASRAFHHDFSASFLIFTALVNIHHFILDGAIWKLRDGRIASLLLNSKDRIADAAAEAGGTFAAACRWIAGGTTAARSLRIGTAMLLLLWGAVDQTRYYLSLRNDDIQDLQRAAAMDGFDSLLQTRLAENAIANGQPQEAEAAWRRALEANPADPRSRQALLQFLIDQNRYDEAYELSEASLRYAPRDANLLVDRGLLAQHRGNPDQARADWDMAISADSNQINAHLFLADELDREGKAQPAAAHYTAYLEKISQLPASNRPAPDRVIAVVLRLADCRAHSAQTDMAVSAYHLAEKLAVETHQEKLESIADVNEAALQSKSGKVDDALALYQRALRLDASIDDDGSSAEDWYTYGQFLEDAGFPPRLAYACMVKSDSLTQALPGTVAGAAYGTPSGTAFGKAVHDSASSIRRDLEKRLGAQAVAIQRDPEPALSEALALKR